MIDPHEITYYRGDFYPKIMTISDAVTSAPIGLTNTTLVLTVNREKDPVDTTNELFKITGIIVGPPSEGRVSFTPTAANNDLAKGKYHYDVSAINGLAAKRTLIKSTWVIAMDIGKD